ncbi:bifunctional oligoribonuclease/PAP phosphatase NrnA [Patescibacteria group bacterium]
MQIEPTQQIKKLLKKSTNVLILLPPNLNGDLISASYALFFLLKEKNVKSTIIASNTKKKTQKLNFLPQPENIKKELSQARDFILAFNTTKNRIANVRTEEKEDELRIYITPEKGSIHPQDFSFIPAKFKYDLVITLGAPDKESLGKVFENNPDIFYEVPIINIDNHSDNDEFGQVNVVNVLGSSICEIIVDLLVQNNEERLSKPIAQCLLAGIIDATESFQNKKTTPKSLQASAMLMGWGADQQEIIRHLYKTQPLHILKLWGRVMAKLNWNEELKLIWSSITVEDFVQSRSNPEDAPLILDKIQENYSSGKIFMLLYTEIPNVIKGTIKSSSQDTLRKIALVLNGKIIEDDLCEFSIEDCSEKDIEKRLLDLLKNK